MIAVSTEKHGRTFIIKVGEDCSFKTGYALESLLGDDWKLEFDTIGLDCENLRFIDTVGIAGIQRVSGTALSERDSVVFFNLSPELTQLFRENSWDKIFKTMVKDEFYKEYSKTGIRR